MYSREIREDAAARDPERERLRDGLGRRVEWGARREKRVAPRSLRVERSRESRAARRTFGGRPWLWKGDAGGAGGEARRTAWAAKREGRAARGEGREDPLGEKASHDAWSGARSPESRSSRRATDAPRERRASVRRRRASPGTGWEALGTGSAALPRREAAHVETCEAPGRAREALRSRGEDSPAISRPSRRGTGARSAGRAALGRG